MNTTGSGVGSADSSRPWFSAAIGVLAVACGLAIAPAWAQAPAPALPQMDDVALLKLMDHAGVRLPPRLFTPELVTRLRQGKPTFLSTAYIHFFGRVELGQRLVAEIPETRWRERIPVYAAFTARAGSNQNIRDSGICPFCGRTYGGTSMTLEEFIRTPFQARTNCCGEVMYEHEADMPVDYKARPNHTEKVPHLDGTTCDYRFYVLPGEEKAGPELGLARRNWFCSASEVWWARERFFHTESEESVLRALSAAAFLAGDVKAGRVAAIILDRLAEVYPGYPLVDNCGSPNGLARATDGKSYLTAAEYRATPVPRRWRKPDWFAPYPKTPYYNLGKMNHASGWQDGVMANLGNLATVFDLIRDRAEVKAYSLETYKSEDAWEEKVRKGVVDELRFGGQWSTPVDGGNTSLGWIIGAIKLSLVTQDPYFLETATEMIGPIVDNHYFSDGMSTEGASNYGSMIRPIVVLAGQLRDCLGLDLHARHPNLVVVERLSDAPVTTLYGVESMHSDEHAFFFSGNGTGWKFPPEKPDYARHEAAQIFPEYGLACLRAGAPGSRLETILDFQTAIAHTHHARLNVQLFYEGVNLLPDVGYACGAVDVTVPPWAPLQYPFEKLPLPPGTDFWGGWYYGFTGLPQVHCTALVDGEHASAEPKGGPLTFQRFLGSAAYSEPGYDAQFVDVAAQGLFNTRPQPVERFQRQIVAVTLANGRPLTLDFFRIHGGQRHDLLWHAPAAGPDDKLDTNLGAPEPVAGSLNDILNRANPTRTSQSAPGQGNSLIQRLGRWAMPATGWQATFQVKPAGFNPVTEGGRKLYAPWIEALHDSNLRLWGAAVGSPAETGELLCGRMPWPSKIREVVDGKEISGVISLKDAFHLFLASRTASAPGMNTTFVTVLEPFNPGQTPVVERVEAIVPDKPDRSDRSAAAETSTMGAGLRITLAAPTGAAVADSAAAHTVLAATTADGGHFSGGGIELDGRLGVVQPANQSLTLFDGTRFAAGGFAVTQEPGWRLKLLGVIGDLTGRAGESALVVEASRPLPTDQTLVGRTLTVLHRISALHSSGYTINRVSPYGEGRYRLDLRDCPSFMVHRFAVREADTQDPRVITVNYWLLKGDGANEKNFYTGRRVRFPKSRFDSAMVLAPGNNAYHHNRIRLDQAPPAGSVKVGDPLIVYQIQPGDEVVIPSHFACKGSATAAGIDLAVIATGPMSLTLPGAYGAAVRLTGTTETPLRGVTVTPDSVRFSLASDELPDGRATLRFQR